MARGGPGGEGGGDGQQQVGWQQQQEEDQRSAFASKAAAAGLLGHAPPSLEHRQAEAGAGAAGVEAAEAGVEAAEGRGVGGEATAGGEEAHPATPPRGPSSSQGAGGEAHPATPHPGLPLPSSSQEAAAPTLASAAPPTSSASGGSSSGSARPPHGSGTMGTSAAWGPGRQLWQRPVGGSSASGPAGARPHSGSRGGPHSGSRGPRPQSSGALLAPDAWRLGEWDPVHEPVLDPGGQARLSRALMSSATMAEPGQAVAMNGGGFSNDPGDQ